MAPTPSPPCPCPECSSLRNALATVELPTVLQHDDGSPVTVRVGDQTITPRKGTCGWPSARAWTLIRSRARARPSPSSPARPGPPRPRSAPHRSTSVGDDRRAPQGRRPMPDRPVVDEETLPVLDQGRWFLRPRRVPPVDGHANSRRLRSIQRQPQPGGRCASDRLHARQRRSLPASRSATAAIRPGAVGRATSSPGAQPQTPRMRSPGAASALVASSAPRTSASLCAWWPALAPAGLRAWRPTPPRRRCSASSPRPSPRSWLAESTPASRATTPRAIASLSQRSRDACHLRGSPGAGF